jgi:hypothetical protein
MIIGQAGQVEEALLKLVSQQIFLLVLLQLWLEPQSS